MKSFDFKTINVLITIMKDKKNVNPTESNYVAMNLYNYLYNVNMQSNLSEDLNLSISRNDLEMIVEESNKNERKYREFQIKMFILSTIVILAIFIIQYFIVKVNIWFSLLVSLSLGLMDLFIINKSLFPKYLKIEKKKIRNNVPRSTLRLCKKLELYINE